LIQISIPMYKFVNSETVLSLLDLVHCLRKNTEFDYYFSMTDGNFIDIARNTLADAAIHKNADYVLFIDSDHQFKGGEVLEFVRSAVNQTEYQIVSGAYKSRKSGKYVAYNFGEFEFPLMEQIKPVQVDVTSKYLKIDSCGLGMCLIPVKILKHIREKYGFIFRCKEYDGNIVGEDTYFFFNCKKEGIKVGLDCSFKVGHCGGVI
jgi:hypothetical protein